YEYEGGLAPRDELFDLLADATALGRRASQALGPYPLILQDLEATRSDDRPLLIVQGLGRT
ncbi:MAG: hypothetical protein GWN85_20690, partial [Gemmatimonadetes bacterium]|nr:hypothetical protein [Gemmatimonadota bacterium]NIR35044.1 hypothetical protein [Actinomycetota bacterium]NIS29094.1 hypothetical protein [Actinomycetota bacterium]NIU64500.1 hypothetical protein [Actinomycetota bacterium]NIW26293.1 hypothetical protein [Actinomycetota bacterium]